MSHTNIFNKILSGCFVFALAITTVFSSIPAQARLAEVVTNVSTPIAADRSTPLTVYLAYGSLTSDTDIVNAVGRLTLNNPSLQFVNTAFEDFYFGDPNRADSVNPPQQPTCNSTYSGPRYAVSASLISTNSITYGLQSARNTTAPSGASTVDRLREKATGCLRVTMAVSPGATPGATVRLTFDEDSLLSTSYAEQSRPGLQIINFTIGPAVNPVSSVSSVASSVAVSSVTSSAVVVSSVTSVPRSSAVVTTTPTPPTQLARTGGLEVVTVLGGIAGLIIGYIGFKVYKRRISKVDLTNK